MNELHLFAGVGGVSSAGCYSDIPAFVPSSSTNTGGKSCSNDSAMESCPASQSGTTCGLSTASRGAEESIVYAAVFPARTYPPRTSTRQTSTGRSLLYGAIWRESSARFDRATSSWKTLQCSLLADSTEFSPTLPRWGMLVDGVLWEGNIWERPEESAFGFWGSPTASVTKDFEFTKEQILRSNFGATHSKYTNQFLRCIDDFPAPEFGEWIMEFPIGWTDLKPLEWRKFQSWRQTLSTRLLQTETF